MVDRVLAARKQLEAAGAKAGAQAAAAAAAAKSKAAGQQRQPSGQQQQQQHKVRRLGKRVQVAPLLWVRAGKGVCYT